MTEKYHEFRLARAGRFPPGMVRNSKPSQWRVTSGKGSLCRVPNPEKNSGRSGRFQQSTDGDRTGWYSGHLQALPRCPQKTHLIRLVQPTAAPVVVSSSESKLSPPSYSQPQHNQIRKRCEAPVRLLRRDAHHVSGPGGSARRRPPCQS